jgi:hypothetical protein
LLGGLRGGTSGVERSAGDGESEVIIQRAEMPIHSGFKERIYIDGREQLVLANGGSGKIIVPNGNHVIHAELYTLTSPKLQFSVSGATWFTITPYSLQDFAIEPTDEDEFTSIAAAPAQPANNAAAPAKPAASAAAPAQTASRPAASNEGGVEGSLDRAAGKIITNLPPKSRIAIVYVTATDPEVTDFIANELEFIMVDEGLIVVDRSQLDRILEEQRLQFSGEFDDAKAVSIGKMAGADIIMTGSVTGTGNLRRLRLRALSTESAQVMAAASDRF